MQTIKKPIEFKKVYKGHKIFTRAFVAHFIENPNASQNAQTAFGFTVSKKTIGKRAVDRNKVKRRFKSCIQEYFDAGQFSGFLIVITATKNTKNATWDDYVASVKYLQKQILNLL